MPGHNHGASWFKWQPLFKKNAPWPHIDRLTFRMFNSYLRSWEQVVANSLPDSISHCLSFLPQHPPWCEPDENGNTGMSEMEFLWMAGWPDSPLCVSRKTQSLTSGPWRPVTMAVVTQTSWPAWPLTQMQAEESYAYGPDNAIKSTLVWFYFCSKMVLNESLITEWYEWNESVPCSA